MGWYLHISISVGNMESCALDAPLLEQQPKFSMKTSRWPNRVKLIGGHDQDAVLVTGSQTFKLTKAETSNTLLLLPPPSEGNSDSLDKQSGSGGVPGSGEIDCQPKVAATQEFEGFEAVAAIGYQYEVIERPVRIAQSAPVCFLLTYLCNAIGHIV